VPPWARTRPHPAPTTARISAKSAKIQKRLESALLHASASGRNGGGSASLAVAPDTSGRGSVEVAVLSAPICERRDPSSAFGLRTRPLPALAALPETVGNRVVGQVATEELDASLLDLPSDVDGRAPVALGELLDG
jgi:hypothetical protein